MKDLLTILIIGFSWSINGQQNQSLDNFYSLDLLYTLDESFNNPINKKMNEAIDTRYNCFKLLDSIHLFSFNDEGETDLFAKHFNTYDDRLNLIQTDKYLTRKDLVTGKSNYKYDENNNLISAIHLARDVESEPFSITKSYQYIYNENHDLTSTILFDEDLYLKNQMFQYFYSEKQLDSLHQYISKDNWESSKLHKSVVFTYENQLKVKSNEIRFNDNDDNWSFKVDTEFQYDAAENLILQNCIEINAAGNWKLEKQDEFKYDSFGNLIYRKKIRPYDAGGIRIYTYEYNENNDLTELCTDAEAFGHNGPYDCTYYTVDECGKILTKEYENFLSVHRSKFTYFYSTHENRMALKNIISFPNPTDGYLYFDEKNVPNNACISIFEINGKLVRQTRLNNHFLDITNLSPGIYILKQASGFSKVIKL